MTTAPETPADVEQELAERLGRFAKGFVAGLEARGRLVETGGAAALKRLREQAEARWNPPEAYQVAVDVIVEDCGYPSEVAVRVADALRRRGILGGDDEEPEPRPQTAPGPTPISLMVRGANVLPRTRQHPEPATRHLGPSVVCRADQALRIRPPAAQPADTTNQRAADWDQAHARAVTVAARLQDEHAGRLEVLRIAPDHERVTVAIRALSLSDWEYWLDAIGAPRNVPTRAAGHAQLAVGRIDGVDVHLTAHGVPELFQQARESAGEPFCLWGRVYDLVRGQVDEHGQTWCYLGQRREDGMPLLALRGGDSPLYPLASIVVSNGPLTAGDTIAPVASAQDAEDEP